MSGLTHGQATGEFEPNKARVLHTGPSAESLCEIAAVCGEMQRYHGASGLPFVVTQGWANRILRALGTREERPQDGTTGETTLER